MNVNDDVEVMVIEDEDDVRLGCLQALQLEGLRAVGYDSVERVPRTLPRDVRYVVVSDIRLPGMDGMAFLRQLVERDADLPVILITGHGDVQTAVQAMRDGAYDFIQKPFQSHELAAVVKRALEKRTLALEVRQLRHQPPRAAGLRTASSAGHRRSARCASWSRTSRRCRPTC